MVQVQVKKSSGKVDLCVVCLHEQEALPVWVDAATQGAAKRALKLGDFAGKLKQSLLLYGEGKYPRVLLVGLAKTVGAPVHHPTVQIYIYF